MGTDGLARTRITQGLGIYRLYQHQQMHNSMYVCVCVCVYLVYIEVCKVSYTFL